MGSIHSDEDEHEDKDEGEHEPEPSHPPDVATTAETGAPEDADGAEGDSRRTFLKATGLLAALGIGSVASSGTAAANPNNHDHLGQVWNGDPGGRLAFGVRTGPNTNWAFQGKAPDRGVFGWATDSSGSTSGVFGRTDSPAGHGMLGISTNSSGITEGVLGRAVSSKGRGVAGIAPSDSGVTRGVFGRADSSKGRAVEGIATADSGITRGVRGFSYSDAGIGVLGQGATGLEGRSTTGDFAVVANGDANVTDFLNVSDLGTTGDTPLDIDVDGQRALRIEPTVSVDGRR
jgi:hypothetical protein